MSNKIIEEKKERLNILIENLEQIQLLADTLADNEIPEETEKNRLAQIYRNFIQNESIFNILLSIDDPNCPEMYFEYVGRCIEERLDKCKANSLATRARPQIQQIVQDRSTSLAQKKELLEKIIEEIMKSGKRIKERDYLEKAVFSEASGMDTKLIPILYGDGAQKGGTPYKDKKFEDYER